MTEARNPAQELADSEFPPQTRVFVAPALKRAYAAVDELMGSVEWLQTPSAKYHRGDLIVLATEHEFARLIDKGSLPLDMAWEPYAAPTGKHLVMRSARAVMTINQVDDAKKKPRHAVFRDHYGLPNMAYLFDYMNEEISQDKTRKHVLLLHGYQQLSFSHLAVPNPITSRLIWWSDNLLNLPHEVSAPKAPEEGPDESPDPQTIDEIIRAVRDSG
jgi:hypothetical protein